MKHKINRLWKLLWGFHYYNLKVLLSNIKKSLLQYQNIHNNKIKTPLILFLQGSDRKIHKEKKLHNCWIVKMAVGQFNHSVSVGLQLYTSHCISVPPL